MSDRSNSAIEIGAAQIYLTRDAGDYEIVVTEQRSHAISFRVYRVLGKTESGVRPYNRDGYESSPDPVEGLADAQAVMSGSIKWDGCSDITIDLSAGYW